MAIPLAALALAAPARAADWPGLDWLQGRWMGEGGGAQQGAGSFSFTREAGGQIVVRRNTADYPPQNGRPAQHHEDFMVIYRDGDEVRAAYWDSEGQKIRYLVSFPEAGVVSFMSEPGPGPRFKLTYRNRGAGRLDGLFQIAQPAEPEGFRTYLAWTARRAP
jgi:hypothetical protein